MSDQLQRPQQTPGDMAVDAAGNPADMPRYLARNFNCELLDVLTLMRSSANEINSIGTESDKDPDCLTSADSRAVSLVCMAEDKVRAMLATISPYV